jgi:3-hydroxyacyl-CoA dehydrogenase
VDFVQENGPERLESKQAIVSEISGVVRPDVIIASSTSGILVSDFQNCARNPDRVVLGHPFNPSHLIPLVEVVGGKQTSPDVLAATLAFYEAIGKRPIHIRRELKGHLANRLQAALWREAFSLVAQGVATVVDVDLAISERPGLRWGLSGPFLNMHLSGGIVHYLDHLGPAIESWWADLGDAPLTAELKDRIAEGIRAELGGQDAASRGKVRDERLLALLLLKRQA